MDDAARERQFEEQFLAQLRARALTLTRRTLPADHVLIEATAEGIDEVRDTLGRLEVYEREAVERMPGTRAVQLRFQRSVLGGLVRQTVSRIRARALFPLEAIVRGQPAGPVGREQVLDALARYQLLPRSERPSGVVLASATGFTPEARQLVDTPGPPTLVLMGLRSDGGWDVDMSAATRRSVWARLFEFETQDDRLRRLLYHLEQEADALDSRGVPLPEIARRLGLGLEETERLVRQACRTNSRLMTVDHRGTVHVCRSPLEDEGNVMSLWARLRRLLGFKPSIAERVRAMTAQRVRLEQQRHEVDRRLGALEADERAALEQARSATTDAERRQIAARLIRVRRELGRVRAQANIFTQQIDVLGTHIHHLTLAEQGRRMELPGAEELTREAAQAEQVIATLSANADLARSIEVTGESPMMAEEELAVLEELRQLSATSAARPADEPPTKAPATPAPAQPERPAEATSAARPAAAPPAGEAGAGRDATREMG